MKIIQLLTTLSFGDAVSNDCLAVNDLLKKSGYDTCIYAENIDDRLKNHPDVKFYNRMPKVSPEDVLLYRLSTGTDLNLQIRDIPCRKFIIYHNTTPPEYFTRYSGRTANLCNRGLKEAMLLSDAFDGGFCDSEFNRDQLISYGYKCPLKVRPILIPMKDYEQSVDEEVLSRMNDGVKNILFVGRIAPNKCQQDLIAMLYAYRQMYKDSVRLVLVGNPLGLEKYNNKLKKYAKDLGIDDVVFTGQVSFKAILAYYKSAHCFVSVSEHEGFCVPLVEAMKFGVPVVAYDSTAIAGTLGGAGILIKDKDPAIMAKAVHTVITNDDLSGKIVEEQRERLKYFEYENVSKMFLDGLKELIG